MASLGLCMKVFIKMEIRLASENILMLRLLILVNWIVISKVSCHQGLF